MTENIHLHTKKLIDIGVQENIHTSDIMLYMYRRIAICTCVHVYTCIRTYICPNTRAQTHSTRIHASRVCVSIRACM